jgi:hypothetical protein
MDPLVHHLDQLTNGPVQPTDTPSIVRASDPAFVHAPPYLQSCLNKIL